MQKINKLVAFSIVKMVFLFFPITALVYYLCYLVGNLLIAKGLNGVLFVPSLLAFMFLVFIAKRMFYSTLVEIKRLHKMKLKNSGG